MTTEEFLAVIKEFLVNRNALLVAKNKDYTTDDPFSNFRAEELGITVEQAILFMIKIKYNRIANLIKRGEKPNFESIADSVRDLANYVDIYYAYLKSQEK